VCKKVYAHTDILRYSKHGVFAFSKWLYGTQI